MLHAWEVNSVNRLFKNSKHITALAVDEPQPHLCIDSYILCLRIQNTTAITSPSKPDLYPFVISSRQTRTTPMHGQLIPWTDCFRIENTLQQLPLHPNLTISSRWTRNTLMHGELILWTACLRIHSTLQQSPLHPNLTITHLHHKQLVKNANCCNEFLNSKQSVHKIICPCM